ncbi:MAG: DUF6090 family protein [Thermoflexibacter sp.]|jgi:hypothetical protein|nr:DUF6090 family protein [Thermoflexibacter sp.]
MKKIFFWIGHQLCLLKKHFFSFDWKSTFRELFLIVAGILIALSINNWNDGRKQRQNEIKMLREIKSNLQSDLKDVEGNLIVLGIMLKNKKIIMESEKTGYQDTLNRYLNNVLYDNVFLVINRSSFESLKSLGLYLISNDSIRLEIVDLYEYDYKIQEMGEMQQHNYISVKANEFARDVMLLHQNQEGRQERYKNLFENTDFKVFIYQAYNFDTFKQLKYQSYEKKLKNLIKIIEVEIRRLE